MDVLTLVEQEEFDLSDAQKMQENPEAKFDFTDFWKMRLLKNMGSLGGIIKIQE